MKHVSKILSFVILLATAGSSCAQQTVQQQQTRQAVAAAEAQVQDASRQLQKVNQGYEVGMVPASRLEEARARLEEAARELAELSGAQHGGAVFINRDFDPNRAVLGINIGGRPDDGKSDGVSVMGVTPDSPADAAGLKAGDLIVKIGDVALTGNSSGESSEKLLAYMQAVEPGNKVNLVYIRDGKTSNVAVETRAMQASGPLNIFRRFNMAGPDVEFSTAAPVVAGAWSPLNFVLTSPWGDMELVELSAGLGKYFGTDKGVLVVKAPSDNTLQLEDGDVILEIDGREPHDPMHALRILQSYNGGESLALQVMRDKRKRKLEVTMPEHSEGMPGHGDAAFITHPGGHNGMTVMPVPAAPMHNPKQINIIKEIHGQPEI